MQPPLIRLTCWALAAFAALGAFGTVAIAQTASQYYPVNPCRIYDSRTDGPATPLTGQELPGRQITVKTNCNIPSDATALSYNITVVRPASRGFLTLYPEGSSLPEVSALNFQANDVKGNGGVVPLGTSAPDLNVYIATTPAGETSHIVLDATGYFKGPAAP